VILAASCGPGLVNRSAGVLAYAARASWQWEDTDHFLLRGRARLAGENQVFSGPFLLWASRSVPAVRGDFSGPDGSPLVSFLLDSTGCLVYQPEQAEAYYFPGGMPAGSGFLDVYAVISLIRTGFPDVPVQWKIVASCDTSSAEQGRWFFVTSSSDTAMVSLEESRLFPTFNSEDFLLEVTSTSWHDEFHAWPMEWSLNSPSVSVLMRIRSFDTQRVPAGSVWRMNIPVAVDTVVSSDEMWRNSFVFPIR
jgi:hypothetical protein